MLFQLPRLLAGILPSGIVGNSLRSKQKSLLRILAVAHSQRLDPKTLIQNLAAEYSDAYGKKLMAFQRWIAAESSMSAALAHTPGALDEQDTLAIQCGIETNTLDETFEFLLRDDPGLHEKRGGDLVWGTAGYVIPILFMAVLITSFLLIFIVPTFEVIFEEFDLALPSLMSSLIEFNNRFGFLVPLLMLVGVGVGTLLLFSDVRRLLRHSVLGRLMPTASALRSAGLMRLLALPVGMGNPVGPTLTAAAQFHPDRNCRKRLLLARTNSQSDADTWSQLADQGLIKKSQSEQLRSIETPSLRAWALRTLADRTLDRSFQKTEFFARLLQHLPIIILGLFVAWVVIAVMQTLTSLIHSLA
jgi:type II secretory pathway component PulF